MKKIFITGASGFIGKNLVQFLLKKNFILLCLSRKKKNNTKNLKWIRGDFSISNKNYSIIKKFKPTTFCHLAWEDIPDFSKQKSKINLKKSKIAISKILKINSIKKIIVSGSCFEYSVKNGIKSEKERVINSKNFFIKAKILLYRFFKKNCRSLNINYIWLRIFFVYGKGQRKKSLIPYLIESFLKNKEIKIKNFSNELDYIYIDDLINAIYKLLIKKNIPSGIYNIGSGKYSSVKKIFFLIKKKLNIKKKYEIKKSKFFFKYRASIIKIKKEINWIPRFTIDQGIKKIISNI